MSKNIKIVVSVPAVLSACGGYWNIPKAVDNNQIKIIGLDNETEAYIYASRLVIKNITKVRPQRPVKVMQAPWVDNDDDAADDDAQPVRRSGKNIITPAIDNKVNDRIAAIENSVAVIGKAMMALMEKNNINNDAAPETNNKKKKIKA